MSDLLDALLLSGVLSNGNKKKKEQTVSKDPFDIFERFTKFLEEQKKKDKENKKDDKKGNLVQQVIFLMAVGPLAGTIILWMMSYMLTDAINHLSRIHN